MSPETCPAMPAMDKILSAVNGLAIAIEKQSASMDAYNKIYAEKDTIEHWVVKTTIIALCVMALGVGSEGVIDHFVGKSTALAVGGTK